MFNSLLIAASAFYFVNSPVVSMRESPEDTSELVSQTYFSEEVKVLEEKANWMKIETTVDHYQGWIKTGQLSNRSEKFPSNTAKKVAKVTRCMAHLYQVPDTVYGPLFTLPFESVLEVIDAEDSRWIKVALPDQKEGFIQRGDISFDFSKISKDQLTTFCLQFQGLPYTWAGRSSFGYDCSGFTQMLYRQIGISLPRDAKDQIKWEGFTAISTENLSPGDFIFFGLDADRIRHVGMYLGADQFIHATVWENAPYIHISRLSDPEWSGFGHYPYRTARTLKK